MSTIFSRSALSVNDDMPSSYFPAAMPGMMPSNALFWNSTFRPSFCADGVAEVDVHADDRRAVGVDELVRRVRRVRADDDLAVGRDVGRHHRGQRVVLLDGRGREGARPPPPMRPPPLPLPPAPHPATVIASSATAKVRILMHMSLPPIR